MTSLFDLPFEDEPREPQSGRDAGSPRDADDGRLGETSLPETSLPTRRVYSVTEITQAVRRQIEQGFPSVWIEGEVADCRPAQSGHVYFALKDGDAQVKAVLFRTEAAQLRFRLTNGLHVLVHGRLSVYPRSGEYQLVADRLEPRGAGALQVAFEQLKKRLQAEGLFDPRRKRALPLLPKRIGIVTSAEGAALHDILRVLRTRRAPADVVISPTRVQGPGAALEIARAIRRLAQVPGVEVMIVGRGGGSTEDLWAFNEEIVARAIAAAPVPVIAAVGHEVDTTIADFVADVRAATPSQAAEIVVRQASELRERITSARRQLALLTRGRIERRRTSLLRLEQRPAFAHIRDRVLDRDRTRQDLWNALETTWRDQLAARQRTLADLGRRLDDQHPRRQLTLRLRRIVQLDERLQSGLEAWRTGTRTRLGAADQRLDNAGLDRRVSHACRAVDQLLARTRQAVTRQHHERDRHLSTATAQLDALSPLRTLARGYAACWDETHTRLLRTIDGVPAGEHVHVQLADGELHCEVQASTPVGPPRP